MKVEDFFKVMYEHTQISILNKYTGYSYLGTIYTLPKKDKKIIINQNIVKIYMDVVYSGRRVIHLKIEEEKKGANKDEDISSSVKI